MVEAKECSHIRPDFSGHLVVAFPIRQEKLVTLQNLLNLSSVAVRDMSDHISNRTFRYL